MRRLTDQPVNQLPMRLQELTPRRWASSTDETPFFAVTIRWMAANQMVSGSLVEWTIVPAVGEVCFLHRTGRAAGVAARNVRDARRVGT